METSIEQLYKLFRKNPSVSTDTRRIKPGSLFFALKGEHFNGNSFASSALANGAAFAVIDEPDFQENERYILVPDVLKALQELALHHRRHLKIPFIAITGSNGKTTSKELVRAVLSTTYQTHYTNGNLNNHIGVPLTLLEVKESHEIAVIEMGANHQQEIEFLCSLAEPTHGLITNIGKAHLEGFGGLEGVKKGKGELYAFLKSHGHPIFIHADQPALRELLGDYKNFISYGSDHGYTISGELINHGSLVTFQWIKKNTPARYQVKTNLTGDYNLSNLLAAVCVGDYFKVEAASINQAISGYIPGNQRSQVTQAGSNTLVIDAYNANPTSMEAALNNFNEHYSGKKMVILGDMLELGKDSQREHAAIVEMVGRMKLDVVVLVGTNFLAYASSINSQFFPDSEAATAWIRKQEFKDMHILIKGSRGLKMEKTLEGFMPSEKQKEVGTH